MKKLLFFFALLLFSCSKKEELRPEFRKVIIDYQKNYPVKNSAKGKIYIYVASFFKEQNDTVFTIFRTSDGILNTNNIYGLYKDAELNNFVVYDKSNLSSKQINTYKKEFTNGLFFKKHSGDINMTPRATYKLKEGIPKHMRTDTIFSQWD